MLDRVGYDCATAADAAEARQLLTAEQFDLMLCDVTMPGESGFSLLAHAHHAHPELAVIMVTAVDSPSTTEPAARHGAYGCILKPFDTNVILINIVGALNRRAERISEIARSRTSDTDNSARIAEVSAQLETLAGARTWRSRRLGPRRSGASRSRQSGASQTPRRHGTSNACGRTRLGWPRWPACPLDEAEILGLASQLHDIGKVGHTRFDRSEVEAVDRRGTAHHAGPHRGRLQDARGIRVPLLRLGSIIALSHHERFDGNGYPHRLVGTAIPLEARIVAIADVFDALRSKRPYKRAYSLQESLEILRNRRRAQLDPELLDLFISDLEDKAARGR